MDRTTIAIKHSRYYHYNSIQKSKTKEILLVSKPNMAMVMLKSLKVREIVTLQRSDA